MNYGLYLSASGMLTGMYRMDVLSGNLANMQTPGFKPLYATTRQRDAAAVEDNLPFLPSDKLLERLGGGVMMMPSRLSMAQGSPKETKGPLDVALDGNGFLVVSAGKSDNPAAVRFSRDGRLTLNAKGQLVQTSTGLPVLDRSDRPITLRPNAPVVIDRSGTISQGGITIAQLQVATVADPSRLRPAGNGLLAAPLAVMAKRTPCSAAVLQGSIEASAVDSVSTIVEISKVERAITSNARMIQAHDELMDRAINMFGKVV